MKKDGKYRFSLQFPDSTEENRLAGEFLEQLGNRKSAVVVVALKEYQENHPEVGRGCKIQISMTSAISKEELEQMVRKVVEEKMIGRKIRGTEAEQGMGMTQKMSDQAEQNTSAQNQISGELEEDISQMLDNLDFF